MTEGTLTRIRAQFEQMRGLAQSAELSARNERVSAWCLAEQLDHTVKVSASIVDVLGNPDSPRLGRGISLLGRLVLWLGWVPRGVGKTPRRLTGTPAAATDLDAALARLSRAFDELPFDTLRVSRVPLVKHPVFGGLTPPQALRLLELHTAHHLKIIADIVADRR